MTLEAKKSVSINKRGPSRGKGDPRAPAPNLHRDKSRSHPDEERDRTPAPNLHRDKAIMIVLMIIVPETAMP
jgi:hypothetical protein